MTGDSEALGYDPYDDKTETGYRRPPKIVGCIADYFQAITTDCDADNPFPHQEMEAMFNHPDTFFTDMDAEIRVVKQSTLRELPSGFYDDDVAVLTRISTGEPIPRPEPEDDEE